MFVVIVFACRMTSSTCTHFCYVYLGSHILLVFTYKENSCTINLNLKCQFNQMYFKIISLWNKNACLSTCAITKYFHLSSFLETLPLLILNQVSLNFFCQIQIIQPSSFNTIINFLPCLNVFKITRVGPKVTTHKRGLIIWETHNRLFSKKAQQRQYQDSNCYVEIFPSPMIVDLIQLVVEIFLSETFKFFICLVSKVMW